MSVGRQNPNIDRGGVSQGAALADAVVATPEPAQLCGFTVLAFLRYIPKPGGWCVCGDLIRGGMGSAAECVDAFRCTPRSP